MKYKRWIAVLMALVMMISVISPTAFAEEPGLTDTSVSILTNDDGYKDGNDKDSQTCICTTWCTAEKVNQECPVCQTDCSLCQGVITQPLANEMLTLSWTPDKQWAAYGESVNITVSGSIDSEAVTAATVAITLSDAEADLLTIPGDSKLSLTDSDATDGEKTLSFTVTADTEFKQTLTATASENATLQIDSDEDVTITYVPSASNLSESLTFNNLSFVASAGTVTVKEKKEIDSVAVGYLNADGTADALPETAPNFSLYYTLDGEKEVALSQETLASVGLTDMPIITTNKTDDKWQASVSEALPVKISVATGQGGTSEKNITWALKPNEDSAYTLKYLNEKDLEDYSGAKKAGWYYISKAAGDSEVSIEAYLETALSQDIFWADNNDAANQRPSSTEMATHYTIEYALDGQDYVALTADNMAQVGLSELPTVTTTDLGGGVWTASVKANTLPSKIKNENNENEVKWRLVPTDTISGYSMVEVTEANQGNYPSVSGKLGTYYVLLDSFSFNLKLNRGTTTLDETLKKEFHNQFYFSAEYTGGTQYFQLNNINDYITSQKNGDNLYTITVSNLWRYNLDNSRMLYAIKEGTVENGKVVPDSSDNRLNDITGPEDGDYFAISYDNSASPGYGNELTQVRNGGTISLTLTGTREFQATKKWLDDGSTARPTAEMHLWRYREGDSFTNASAVRDSNNQFITLTLENDGEDSYNIQFDNLAKYDPEGYKYLYVVREYLSGTNADAYEKVFGSIADNGTIIDIVEGKTVSADHPRDENNTWLYNGGTLSNRLKGTIPVSVTKVWKAASFQSEFDDVMVELRLQSRLATSTDENDWKDTEYTYQMADFYAENLTDTYTGSYPAYNAQGQPLEYRWVEEAVYQGGKVDDEGKYSGGAAVKSDISGDTRTFTLKQAGRDVSYASTTQTTTDTDGISRTTITNTITDTLYYQVKKEWENSVQPHACTFVLYRMSSDGVAEEYVRFGIDGNVESINKTLSDGTSLTITEDPAWTVKVSGLPEFDSEGRKYEYMLLEQDGQPRSITTTMKDNNYESVVINGDGTGTHTILVRKAWVDDSDIQHREPVTITVYDKKTNQPLNINGKDVSTVLSSKNGWYDLVNIGSTSANDVYILETKVGENEVAISSSPQAPDANTRVKFSTDNHVYEATYSTETIVNVSAFTVTNRRLGNIDLTVTKSWVDGDGTARQTLQKALDDVNLHLAVKLDFLNGNNNGAYTISYNGYGKDDAGDTVTISEGNATPIQDNNEENPQPVDAIQNLNLGQKEQTIYFWNLPKYDANGASVRYTVEEVIVDDEGNAVDLENSSYSEIAEAYENYRLSFKEEPYIVGKRHAHDEQSFTLTNGLSATKTVNWYCLWLDDYVYNGGNRPDIYLDIYARKHTSETETELILYRAEYKWEYKKGADGTKFWVCTLDGLPRFDDFGYEIDYFATVDSTVNYEDFSYVPVQYSADEDQTGQNIFGSEQGLNNPNDDANGAKIDQINNDDYALMSGNTFVFQVAGSFSYAGEKLWKNMPGSYPDEDLPTVTFVLDRQISGEPEKTNVASITVTGEDWEKLKQNDGYIFELRYEGVNELDSDGQLKPSDDQDLLPAFDTESGKRYEYHLHEVIDWQNTDAGKENDTASIFQTTELGRVLENNYQLGNAQLSAKKYLTVAKDLQQYPAITLVLSRTYKTNDGSESAAETVETVVWNAADVKQAVDDASGTGDTVTVEHVFTFENLPTYAPNGSKYVYTITEDKTELGGYDTWAAADDVEAQDIEMDENKGNYVTPLTPDENTTVDATFLNKPGSEELTIHGEKVWTDLNNAFGFRPEVQDGVTLTVQSIVGSQTGQGNQVGWTTVAGTAYEVVWQENDTNSWAYTIKGLPRYASNGMPYTYRITESVAGIPEHYKVVYNGHVQTDSLVGGEGTSAVTVRPFTNTLLTQAAFNKTWQDESGDPLENVLKANTEVEVVFQLQVKPDNGSWQNATEYFKETLSEQALTASGLESYQDSKTIRAAVTADVWNKGDTFENLPKAIKDKNGNSYSLSYRVVEKELSVYSDEDTPTPVYQQNINVDDNGDYSKTANDLFTVTSTTDNESGVITIVNTYTTTSLTVKKIWEGETTGTGTNWSVNFLLQLSTDDGTTWQNTNQVKTVSGTSIDKENSGTFSQLPKYVLSDEGILSACVYRAVELQPNTDVSQPELISSDNIVEDGGIFGEGYLVSYDTDPNDGTQETVTNQKLTGLTISKKVDGLLQNPETEFAFTLTLSNTTVTGTYGDLTFDQGVATFTLKNHENVTVSGLQVGTGTTYTIEETNVQGANSTQTSTTIVTDSGNTTTSTPGKTATGRLENDSVVSVCFTNSYTPETVDIPVEKQWNDSDNQTGKRPASITVQLYANSIEMPGKTLELNEDNSWKNTFEGLPKNDNSGSEIKYNVQETPVLNYTPSYTSDTDGFVITNSYTPETVDIPVEKRWEDNNNQASKRPASITVQLYANSIAVQDKTLTLDEGNGWKNTFTNLSKYDLYDKEITYTIEEVTVAGYTTTITGDAVNGFVITNRYKTTPPPTPMVDVSGDKTWNDSDNQDGKRPERITIRLYANGVEVANKVVTAADNWHWNFSDLPKYEDGQEIVYTITEDAIDGYTSTVSGSDVTNTYTPDKTTVSVTKSWQDKNDQDGKRPESIIVKLFADGVDTGKTLTLSKDNNWTASFGDLDVYKGGQRITYTIEEVTVDGYTTAITGDAVNGFVITNSYKTTPPPTPTPDDETVDVSGDKTWSDSDNQDGKRPERITIRLYANGVEVANKVVTAADNWHWNFSDLPKTEDGKDIVYTIKEDPVEGYTSTVNGYDVTNTYDSETVDVSGDKTWSDSDNQDGKRPERITIRLYANGVEVAHKVVTAADNWHWDFSDLPKYEDGQEIVYTITEDAIDGYTSTVSGSDVTNTYTPDKTTVSVTKSWQDKNDQDGKRPERITVKLFADGVETGKTLVLSKDNNWTASFGDLDVYKDGQRITYTIEEVKVDGYTTTISGDAVTGFVITNSTTTDTTPPGDNPPAENPPSETTPGTPSTGDTSHMNRWLALMAVAAAGMAGSALLLRRRRNRKD